MSALQGDVLSGTLAAFKSWAATNPGPTEEAARKLGILPTLLAAWAACATVRQVLALFVDNSLPQMETVHGKDGNVQLNHDVYANLPSGVLNLTIRHARMHAARMREYLFATQAGSLGVQVTTLPDHPRVRSRRQQRWHSRRSGDQSWQAISSTTWATQSRTCTSPREVCDCCEKLCVDRVVPPELLPLRHGTWVTEPPSLQGWHNCVHELIGRRQLLLHFTYMVT